MNKVGVADSKACEYGLFVARSLIGRGPGVWKSFDVYECSKFQSLCQVDEINER